MAGKKLLHAILENSKRRDNVPVERYHYNRVRAAIDEYCEKYLKDVNDIFKFEALPDTIDATLEYLESKQFLERYEFSQESETVFLVRLREYDFL